MQWHSCLVHVDQQGRLAALCMPVQEVAPSPHSESLYFLSGGILRLWRGAHQRELWEGEEGGANFEVSILGPGRIVIKAAVFWSPPSNKNTGRYRNRYRLVAAFFSPRRPGGEIFVAGCISKGQPPPSKKLAPIPGIKKPAFR